MANETWAYERLVRMAGERGESTTIFVALDTLSALEARIEALEADNARKTAALSVIADDGDESVSYDEMVRRYGQETIDRLYGTDQHNAEYAAGFARTVLSASDEQATLVTGEGQTNG